MRILFDHQVFTLQNYGGVSRSFVELYKRLAENNDINISLRETNNAYLRALEYGYPVGYDFEHFITHRYFRGKGHLFALRNSIKYNLPYVSCLSSYSDAFQYGKCESIKALRKGDFDVFHPTYYDDYFLPYLNGKPFVLTIHDMIPELYPQYFDAEKDEQIQGKRKLAPLASAIIAVSENTKRDVINILGVPEEKVHVVYHGSEHINRFVSDNHIDENYLLYVGARDYYKDFDLFVEKASDVLKQHPELSVVCTGKPFSEDELCLFAQYGIQDRFVHKWVADDEEMAQLYNNAKAFIYTSEYEGFGIPILEAYAADCPALLNKASCFPEIAGDAAEYFTFDNLCEQLEKVINMSSQDREELIIRQRSRLELYSWERSAQQVEAIYKSVLA